MPLQIDDPLDVRLDDYRDLQDAARLERRGLFVAEGRFVVRRLLAGGRFRLRSILVTAPARAALEAEGPVPDEALLVVQQAVMDGVAGYNVHRGCLAIAERGTPMGARELVRGARLVVVLERVANPDNVGGIFRNAAAFGVDAVLLDEASGDPFYRKAIRTSMAATLQVPFSRCDPLPDGLAILRQEGLTLVALTPAPEAPAIGTVAQALRDRRVALVAGHEGEGLTPGIRAACDLTARIPMCPGVDSLNVATAVAVALHQLRTP